MACFSNWVNKMELEAPCQLLHPGMLHQRRHSWNLRSKATTFFWFSSGPTVFFLCPTTAKPEPPPRIQASNPSMLCCYVNRRLPRAGPGWMVVAVGFLLLYRGVSAMGMNQLRPCSWFIQEVMLQQLLTKSCQTSPGTSTCVLDKHFCSTSMEISAAFDKLKVRSKARHSAHTAGPHVFLFQFGFWSLFVFGWPAFHGISRPTQAVAVPTKHKVRIHEMNDVPVANLAKYHHAKHGKSWDLKSTNLKPLAWQPSERVDAHLRCRTAQLCAKIGWNAKTRKNYMEMLIWLICSASCPEIEIHGFCPHSKHASNQSNDALWVWVQPLGSPCLTLHLRRSRLVDCTCKYDIERG